MMYVCMYTGGMADSHDVCMYVCTQVVMADSYYVCTQVVWLTVMMYVCMYTGGDG